MRSIQPHQLCDRGVHKGAPILVIECPDTASEALELVRNNRGNNTQFVLLSGPRSWDGQFCSDVARGLVAHELTQDITLRLERGIFSPDWPYATESTYISLDCSILFDNLGTPAEFQERLTEEIGILPNIDELLVTIKPEVLPMVSFQHLDILAYELSVGELFVECFGKTEELTKIITKCTTPWRVG